MAFGVAVGAKDRAGTCGAGTAIGVAGGRLLDATAFGNFGGGMLLKGQAKLFKYVPPTTPNKQNVM